MLPTTAAGVKEAHWTLRRFGRVFVSHFAVGRDCDDCLGAVVGVAAAVRAGVARAPVGDGGIALDYRTDRQALCTDLDHKPARACLLGENSSDQRERVPAGGAVAPIGWRPCRAGIILLYTDVAVGLSSAAWTGALGRDGLLGILIMLGSNSNVLVGAVIGALAAGAVGRGGVAVGEDFCVVNRVFVGNEKQPRVKSTTIFSGGVVYDYLEKPSETTIFDPAHNRFVLLDSARKVMTELSTDNVLELIERLRRRFSTSSDPYQEFLADPGFDERFDDGSGESTFSSPWMTYRVLGKEAPSLAIARQYREFSDWQVRLNSLLNPGSRLPFPRMILRKRII